VRKLGTAAERREQIRAAASAAFAESGLHGVSVDQIARSIDISEAYVFRLFGSKRALFIDVVTTAFDTMTSLMAAAAGEATGVDALMRMGEEYQAQLAGRQRLLLQTQAFAACGDPVVLEAVRAAFGRLWARAGEISGLSPLQVKTFIAFGTLHNILAAMDADGLPVSWAEQATVPVPAALYRPGEMTVLDPPLSRSGTSG
jgi:AcrR family transcriptional regulator